MRRLYDPIRCREVDEAACERLSAGLPGVELLRGPGGPWFVLEVWTGRTRALRPSEAQLVEGLPSSPWEAPLWEGVEVIRLGDLCS